MLLDWHQLLSECREHPPKRPEHPPQRPEHPADAAERPEHRAAVKRP